MGIFSAECWSILCWWGHHGRDKEKKEVIDCLLSKGPQERAEVAMINEYINGYTWHTGMHVTEQPAHPPTHQTHTAHNNIVAVLQKTHRLKINRYVSSYYNIGLFQIKMFMLKRPMISDWGMHTCCRWKMWEKNFKFYFSKSKQRWDFETFCNKWINIWLCTNIRNVNTAIKSKFLPTLRLNGNSSH